MRRVQGLRVRRTGGWEAQPNARLPQSDGSFTNVGRDYAEEGQVRIPWTAAAARRSLPRQSIDCHAQQYSTSLTAWLQRIRDITRRAKGISMTTTMEELAPLDRLGPAREVAQIGARLLLRATAHCLRDGGRAGADSF
jgi:hypothetical protein